ncbi:MAG: GtrA family protein [Terriglobia bacterium]
MKRIRETSRDPAAFPGGTTLARRWLAFNFVGFLGILIQLSTLAILTGGLGMHYLVATGLAVEAAVLHNFIWHEKWTWYDRSGHDKENMWKRMGRFHLANGALSVGGNLILMRIFVGSLSINYVFANVLTICVCSILNFLAGDRFVFREARRELQACNIAVRPKRIDGGDVFMEEKSRGEKQTHDLSPGPE